MHLPKEILFICVAPKTDEVTSGMGVGMGEMDESDQKMQMSSYEINHLGM